MAVPQNALAIRRMFGRKGNTVRPSPEITSQSSVVPRNGHNRSLHCVHQISEATRPAKNTADAFASAVWDILYNAYRFNAAMYQICHSEGKARGNLQHRSTDWQPAN